MGNILHDIIIIATLRNLNIHVFIMYYVSLIGMTLHRD